MPVYSYVCDACGHRYYDWQPKYTGSREILCPKCIDKREDIMGDNTATLGNLMRRDYHDEQATVMPDWEPGYNPGIDYHYKNKGDLMSEIKRRGLYPSVHGGGIHSSRATPGLYGDEEFHKMYSPSKPEQEDEEIRS